MAQAQGDSNTPTPRRNATEAEGAARRAADETVQAGRSFAEDAARGGEETVRLGGETARTALDGFADTVNRAFGFGDERAGDLAQQSARNLRATSDAATALSRGAQEVWQECLRAAQDGVKANVEAVNRFAACRSAPDLLAAQSELWRENVRRTVSVSQTIARTSLAAMEDAGRALSA